MESIETLVVTSGTLSVMLTNAANGYVVADAIRLVRDDLPAVAAVPAIVHNSVFSQDVNGDGHVSAIDALIVINAILSGGPTSNAAASAASPAALASPAVSSTTPSDFLDVNGDGRMSAIDALMVINFLLNPPTASSAVGAVPPRLVTVPIAAAHNTAASSAVAPAAAIAVSQTPTLAAVAVDQAIGELTMPPATIVQTLPPIAPASATVTAPTTTAAPAPATSPATPASPATPVSPATPTSPIMTTRKSLFASSNTEPT